MQLTWSPPQDLFAELLEVVKSNKKIKYVSWSLEGVRLTVKRDDGTRELVELPNEADPGATIARAKEIIKII